MKTIWKYELQPTDTQHVFLPLLGKIRSVQAQGNKICMWVEHDSADERQRTGQVTIAGTGHEIIAPDYAMFIGTVQLAEGALVLHVFFHWLAE